MADINRARELQNDLRTLSTPEILAKWEPGELVSLRPLIAEMEAAGEQAQPGFLTRAAASFANSGPSEINILREQGVDAFADQGRPMFRAGGSTFPVDPEGFDVGDIGDMVGRIPSTALGVLGGMTAGPAGAGAGALMGGALEQTTANLLGGKSQGNVGEVLTRAGTDAALEAALPFVGKLAKAPFRGKGLTPQAERIDAQLGSFLTDNLPFSLQTNSTGLQGFEQFLSESPITRGAFERNVRQPFEQSALDAFDKLRTQIGPLSTGREATGQQAIDAMTNAVEARKVVVDNAYKELESVVPSNTTLVPTNTLRAIGDIQRGAFNNPKFDLGQEARRVIEQWASSAENVQTFKDLNDLRKLVGAQLDVLDSAARRTGMDAEAGRLYGALAEDVLAIGGAASTKARNLAKSDISTRTASINRSRALRDEDKIETLVPDIMSGSTTSKQVNRWRQRIGDQPTPEGLPSVQGGPAAWRQIQVQVLEELRDKSIKGGREAVETDAGETFSAISGARMMSDIERMGGPEKLKAIFGDEVGEYLFSFAALLRNSEGKLKAVANPSGTAQSNQLFDLVKMFTTRPAQFLATVGTLGAAASPFVNPGVRKLVTQGIESPRAQNLVRGLGRVGAFGIAADQPDETAR